MKSGFLAVAGAFAILFLSGPAHRLAQGPAPEATAMPVWMSIPAQGEVSNIAFTGRAGQEETSGIVELNVAGDGEAEFNAMKIRLAANGFEIRDSITSVDQMFGASSYAIAEDRDTGRSLQIVRMETAGGAAFRLVFENPNAQVAQIN